MRKRLQVALALLFPAVLGVVGWQVLRMQEPVRRSLEVRLQRLTSKDAPPGDFLDKLGWMTRPSPQAWTAVFEISNSWGRTVGVKQVLRDDGIVGRDSKANHRLVVAVCYLRPHERMEQQLSFSVPPESTMCRFRVVYWPATARERWRLLGAKWPVARRYPAVFNWVTRHLPHTPREFEALREVSLPVEAELLPGDGGLNDEPR